MFCLKASHHQHKKLTVQWQVSTFSGGDLFVWLVGFFTSSSATRLYDGWVSRLTSHNFTYCHTRDRAGTPWLLSQPVTLYWHWLNHYGAGGHIGNWTFNLLTRSWALYRLSYRLLPPPPPQWWGNSKAWCNIHLLLEIPNRVRFENLDWTLSDASIGLYQWVQLVGPKRT